MLPLVYDELLAMARPIFAGERGGHTLQPDEYELALEAKPDHPDAQRWRDEAVRRRDGGEPVESGVPTSD